MSVVYALRESRVGFWLLSLLAMLLLCVALDRVAGAAPDEPRNDPVASYIISPCSGTFVAGAYRGAEPYVSAGSQLEPGTIVGNVEVWGTLHPVYSMVRGTVTEVLIGDDAMVVTWQPLFKIQLEPEPTPA
jgi:biotin carboxyl carrier protein